MEAAISNRTIGDNGCPFCVNRKIFDYNSLQALFPDIISEWDFKSNNWLLSEIAPNSHKLISWMCKNNT